MSLNGAKFFVDVVAFQQFVIIVKHAKGSEVHKVSVTCVEGEAIDCS